MSLTFQGSTWKKWDLHVHTPESFVHNYPGEKELAWNAFLNDLEALPRDFKVIGINDYVLVDGYERVLNEKRVNGRLSNIDLILPVLELRLDKFGGVVRSGKDSAWSRINYHVIFDQVDPEFIRQQFLSSIAPHYNLTAGSLGAGKWGGVITRRSIEDLGKAIIEAIPDNERNAYGAPLIEGFNNLNISSLALTEALKNPHLSGKFLLAIGKTEWEDLKWNDHTIAEKKTLINNAHLVFTAAPSPEAYARARAKLRQAQVNDYLLDCSDAHWLSSSSDKDRIGNCFTWIKADATFCGLRHAIEEFEERVYVGDTPPKNKLVSQNRTKFIRTISVSKKIGSSITQPWFDLSIPLNSDLVAVIGNKGSGKSALADIIALAGSAKNYTNFSFLTASRFRNPRTRLAQHFQGTLTWHDGSETTAALDQDPLPSSVERVKYLPQSYLEDLCNQLGDGGSNTFDAELRKIIYSHVPEEDRLGRASADELLAFKMAEIDQAKQAIKRQIATLNKDILDTERRSTAEFRKALEEHLRTKQGELSSLQSAKPQPIDDPSTSLEAQEETRQAAAEIDALEAQLQAVTKDEGELRDRKADASKRLAIASRITQALVNFEKHHEAVIKDLAPLVAALGLDTPASDLLTVRINRTPLSLSSDKAQKELEDVDGTLQSVEPESLHWKREQALAAIADAKSRLGERQRKYVQYRDELARWDRAQADLIGTRERPGTISWLEAEIEGLSSIPAKLTTLQARRATLARELYKHLETTLADYQGLYGPVQNFVKSAEHADMGLPLEFHVRIEESAFHEQFFSRLNKQIRGSFCGVEEGSVFLKKLLQQGGFANADEALAFAVSIDDALHFDRRDGQQSRPVRLSDQVRKGVEPIDVLNYLYSFDYLSPRYSLTYAGQEISQLSPGERGLLLLVFYLLVDKDDIPIVIDQPEENLDNQTVFRTLVKCIKKAKQRRQVIMVTHNPNLAVVCDAEQIILASCDKTIGRFQYEAGAIERPEIKDKVVQVLEGTQPAFTNRQKKYAFQ